MDHKKIVVIEKDKILKSILELFIEQLGYSIASSFLNFREAIEYIQDNNVDILLVDLNTFDNNINLQAYIKLMEDLHFPILFIGNPDDIEIAKQMLSFNIYSFMSKPVTKNILKINIEIACSKHKRIEYNKQEASKTSCLTSCKVNSQGEIIEYASDFLKVFNIETQDLNNTPLKDILKDNPNFIKFEDFSRSIDEQSEGRVSVFPFNNNIYSANITKESTDTFHICFKITLIDYKIFYENLNLEARFNTLFENSSESVLIFDCQNNLINFNTVAKTHYKNITNIDLYAGLTFFDIFQFIPKHELNNILETLRTPAIHKLNRTIHNNGKDFNLKIKISPIHSEEQSSIGGYIITATEITKEIQLQKKINVLKDEFKPVYESTIQRFYLVDINKKIVAFNESAFKIIQKEHNHSLKKGDSILHFVPNEIGQKQFEETFQKVLKGEHLSFKTKISSSIGEYWNEVHYDPIINEKGELNRVLIWTLDITESENNLIALNESNKRYELVAKGGNDGLWDWDLRTNEVYLSPRWKSLLGYEDDEIKNEFGIRDLLTHPEDKASSEQKLLECLNNTDDVFHNEIRLLCKDQSYKWILERGIILREENGKPYRLAGSITDITDRKEAENTLLKLNQSLLEERSMFITGNVGIIRVNAHKVTEVSYISKNSQEITGYTALEFYNGQVPFNEIIYPDDRELHRREREEAFVNNQSHIDFSDYRLVKKDGSIIWLKDFTTIIRNDKGEIIDLLGYFIDITKDKITEVEYENIQNTFSALWQSLDFEIFITDQNGKILHSTKQEQYSIQKLLENTFYIYEHFDSLANWKMIQNNIDEIQVITQEIDQNKYQIKISKIDSDRLLISSNIPIH